MDVNSNLVLENQKKIWEKSRNTDEYKTEIDDFYL